METLKICVATPSFNKGNGIDVSVAQLASELAKKHDVTLVATSSDMEGLDVRLLPATSPHKLRGIARTLDKERFDIFSSHFTPFDLVGSFMKAPHMLHDAGVPPLRLLGVSGVRFWAQVSAARIISCRNAATVLPISEYLGRKFRSSYGYRGPIDVLPYSVEFPKDEPEPIREYGRYVLYVGRHTPYKGVDKLIEAFSIAKKALGGDVSLVTVGLGEKAHQKKLETLAARAGNVHMLGYVEDVWPYFAGASVYATCSGWEGQDRPVIEAQYMGKPVVAFDNCSHPEVVTHGTTVKNKEEFAAALVKYLSKDHTDPCVRDIIVEKFSPEPNTKRYLSLVRGLINDER